MLTRKDNTSESFEYKNRNELEKLNTDSKSLSKKGFWLKYRYDSFLKSNKKSNSPNDSYFNDPNDF